MTSHRVVSVPLELHEERDGANSWRCANCHATRQHPDEFDDFDCSAVALPIVFESESA